MLTKQSKLAIDGSLLTEEPEEYTLEDFYNYLKNKRYEAFIENFPVLNQYSQIHYNHSNMRPLNLMKYIYS